MAKYVWILIFGFLLGKFTYLDSNGYGIFVPMLGGYHIATESK